MTPRQIRDAILEGQEVERRFPLAIQEETVCLDQWELQDEQRCSDLQQASEELEAALDFGATVTDLKGLALEWRTLGKKP